MAAVAAVMLLQLLTVPQQQHHPQAVSGAGLNSSARLTSMQHKSGSAAASLSGCKNSRYHVIPVVFLVSWQVHDHFISTLTIYKCTLAAACCVGLRCICSGTRGMAILGAHLGAILGHLTPGTNLIGSLVV